MNTTVAPPRFDAELVARYDVAGPRYTSYPTAPRFHDRFGEPQLRQAIDESNEVPIPIPLSLYVHVPFCASPCFYCGCNRIITRDVRQADQYLGYLYREIESTAPLFDSDRPVHQLHFGGGTPNFLDADRMDGLMRTLHANFSLAADERREFGVEIDPRYCEGAYIRALGDMGFNRISVGVQDFDPDVQKAVNRIQSVGETREVIDAARASGYTSVNLDLIYGLPRQTLGGFERTLDTVLAMRPDRLAVYGYAHMPALFKPQTQIKADELPDPATRLRLLGLAVERLTRAGYTYIGMDHFARDDDDLVHAQHAGTLQRNFQGYSTHAECDIIGLGVSAIGRIGPTYDQNVRDLAGYYLALENGRLPVARGIRLQRDDVIRRAAINQLMCHGRLDMERFGAAHEIDFRVYFAAELVRLQKLAEDGLLRLDKQTIQVSARGRYLLRIIAMTFDVYLDKQDRRPHYSSAI